MDPAAAAAAGDRVTRMSLSRAGRSSWWMFRHKRLEELDEQSGRTTGRFGYTWPTTAYAIGGTAALALRS